MLLIVSLDADGPDRLARSLLKALHLSKNTNPNPQSPTGSL
jgi:hypothetical protein